jgi:uncharacterized surface protein with fasciclin (FAS1) repeats
MKTTLATRSGRTAALVLSLLVAGSVGGADGQSNPTNDIVDTAVAAGSFKTLVAAVQAAGLVDALKGEGPFTVFAPTDEAFAKFPPGTVPSLVRPENKDTLIAILTYHVAPGRLPAAMVTELDRIETLNGQRPEVRIDGESIMIDNATVIASDIMTSNGVIHVIDAVILPSRNDVVTTAIKAGSFNTLTAALEAADLLSVLHGEGPFTIFAPNDDAFAKLPAGTLESLLKPENKDRLTAVLTYHVVPGLVYSADARPGGAETLEGSSLRISKSGDSLLVDDARIVTPDISATNGVIHVVDSVILPAPADE